MEADFYNRMAQCSESPNGDHCECWGEDNHSCCYCGITWEKREQELTPHKENS